MATVPVDMPQIPDGPNVGFVRFEIANLLEQYYLIRDCLAGEHQVKKLGDKYLPRPNADDMSQENKSRYDAYKLRAVFYNFTKRTLAGLVGQIFVRDPAIVVPKPLEILKADFSGSGTNITQFASSASSMALSYGRAGLFVDYPDADAPTSVHQIITGQVRPAVLLFPPWEIINWRTIVRNGRLLLSLVVIHESVVEEDDGFQQKNVEQWRVLTLKQIPDGQGGFTYGNYSVQIYRKSGDAYYGPFGAEYEPKDANGKSLTEIPFIFIGVKDNDPSVDEPPLYDLASLNIAHYRNSADYEEASFIVGQATPVVIGITQQWAEDVLKGNVTFGSRKAVMLPVGADMKLVQAQPNSVPKEAMDMKEREAVALGAKLVEQKSVQRTLGEAELENAAENSVLANVGKNVEAGVLFALQWCMRLTMRGNPDVTTLKFDLNTEFDLTQLDQAERAETIREWQQGAITTTEMRVNLRRGGIATLPDDQYKAEKAKDDAERLASAKALAEATAPPKPSPNTPVSGVS